MAKIAVIGAVLENPGSSQQIFNDIVSEYKDIIRGRMGLPMNDKGIAVISITVIGGLDTINSFVGRLGKVEGVTVKAAFSKGEY